MVLTVIAAALTIAAAFLAAAIPPLASEATALAHQIPHYMHSLQDRNSQLGKLNVKYHIQERLTGLVTKGSGGGSLVGGVLGAGALVIRYVLEVCGTVEEAARVLCRVPVHMSYNVTVLDGSGRWATAYLAPDRPARITDLAVVTNHQGEVEWAPYAAAIRSVERPRPQHSWQFLL